MTIIIALARKHWFDTTSTPEGQLLRFVLLVHCQANCRLKDMRQGCWVRTHQVVNAEGETIERQAGTSTRGLLRGWSQLRDEFPDLPFWRQYEVWGAPNAWLNQGIAIWYSDFIQEE